MKQPLVIDYYTDVLCIWAWIAQCRVDELNRQLGDKIEIRYHYVDVFGDVPSKMGEQWEGKGHYEGYARHVRDAVQPFNEVELNTRAWSEVRPVTSGNVHLALKAVELVYGRQKSIEMDRMLREAFFVKALDIGDLTVVFSLLETQGLDIDLIRHNILKGDAMAALMGNYRKAKILNIKGSPSYVIDGGRQTLYGNVGYRVIRANIEELLKQPQDEASWC